MTRFSTRTGALALVLGLSSAGAWAQSGQPLQLRPPAPAPAAVKPTPAKPPSAPPKPAASASSPAARAAATAIPLPVPRPASLTENESTPAPLPAAPATSVPALTTPAAAPARPPAASSPPVDQSPRTVLERATAALNGMTVLTADFVQVGGNGSRAEGKVYMQKPGKVRFEYRPPAQLEIVADGNSVVIRDRRAGTQDLYGIAQTPLKFLLKDKVDLTRDTRVIDVQPAPDLVSVLLEDRATFGGTSRIELFFDPKTYTLRQWTIVDPQGYQTTVNLKNIDTKHEPDSGLFFIDYTKSMPPQMQNNR